MSYKFRLVRFWILEIKLFNRFKRSNISEAVFLQIFLFVFWSKDS